MKKRSFLTGSRSSVSRSRGGGLFSSFGRLAATVVAVVVALMLILRLVAPGALATVASPLWRLGSAFDTGIGERFSLASRVALTRERDALAAENETLRNQNAVLTARSADFEKLLGGRTESTRGILAGVLARPPVSPYDTIVIDEGTVAGVTVHAMAFGPGGVPIGVVSEAGNSNARVTLYSASGRATDGWAGANRVPVKLIGVGAGAFEAEVPGTAGVVVGDAVFVPGPGALPIGTVVEIVTDPSSPTVGLRVKPFVNPFSLTWVTIGAAS